MSLSNLFSINSALAKIPVFFGALLLGARAGAKAAQDGAA